MRPTVFQKAELRDENDVIVQQGTYGKGSALSNSTNDGWIDYVMNNLEALYGIAKDEVVPVSSLPSSGDMNKTYLLTTTGVCYRWDGTEWVEISSSEAVGRAEAAADLAEEWATKTSGTVDGSEYSAKHYSNVSKDWANKLNATVDGSEYSAKYYANAAQQSADDAQDVADDMADHLAQIDQNTGGVSANSKRITNIEKLLQGNLYDYQTDSTSAYTKSVPSGAMPYAGLEKVGGKTIVWNQLCNFTVASKELNGVTWTRNADNSYTVNGTATGGNSFCDPMSAMNIPKSHKLLIKGCPQGGSADTYWLQDGYFTWAYDYGAGGIVANRTNTYTMTRMVVKKGTTVNNLVFKPLMFDLTAMFGAGNEPSTVEEFESMFPADYYEYNAGTLLSAGVTEVESVGKNLADVSSATAGINGIAYTYNTTTKKFTAVGTSSGNADSAIVFTKSIFLNVNDKITISMQGSGTFSEFYFYLHDKTTNNYPLYFSTTAITNGRKASFTVTQEIELDKMLLRLFSGNSINCEFGLQIERGESVTPYKPYLHDTYPIPASVQALEGYGWSAGDVYNYIDYERKVFVKRLYGVDMGNCAWHNADSSGATYSTALNGLVGPPRGKYRGALCCVNYKGITRDGYPSDKEIAMGNAQINLLLQLTDSNFANKTGEEIRTALAGQMLYYEMETPQEIDISEYLTDDNLINVESGGTLTFPNQNGTDYQIPVPSEETYMIDLQASLGG